MASIKVKLRQSTVHGKEGTLFFQLINKRVVKMITTRFKLHAHEWDPESEKVQFKNANRDRHDYLHEAQAGMEMELKRLEEMLRHFEKKGTYTLHELADSYASQSLKGDLFLFMEYRIKKLQAEQRIRTAQTYATVKRSFHAFLQGGDIRVAQLNTVLMQQYESYLKKNQVSMNSISCYMRVLRAVYNRAVEEDLCTRQYPFKNVYTGISKTVKRAVDEETIIRIKALDLSKFPVLVLARDLFMFSFYTRGMSFVDMANLTDDNLKAGYLIYTRSKTSQKLTIRTEPCMDEIIARYRDLRLSPFLLPIYHSESRDPVGALRTYNKRLVRISRLLGLEKPLSSYVSRHTWATLARHRGVSLPVISESMGHENEYTTRIYLASLEQSVIDQANAQVIAL